MSNPYQLQLFDQNTSGEEYQESVDFTFHDKGVQVELTGTDVVEDVQWFLQDYIVLTPEQASDLRNKLNEWLGEV